MSASSPSAIKRGLLRRTFSSSAVSQKSSSSSLSLSPVVTVDTRSSVSPTTTTATATTTTSTTTTTNTNVSCTNANALGNGAPKNSTNSSTNHSGGNTSLPEPGIEPSTSPPPQACWSKCSPATSLSSSSPVISTASSLLAPISASTVPPAIKEGSSSGSGSNSPMLLRATGPPVLMRNTCNSTPTSGINIMGRTATDGSSCSCACCSGSVSSSPSANSNRLYCPGSCDASPYPANDGTAPTITPCCCCCVHSPFSAQSASANGSIHKHSHCGRSSHRSRSGTPESENNTIVRLNVGGVIYMTTKDTLVSRGESFFTGLMSGRIPTLKDETGALFIDRNGKLFEPILDYMRTGLLEVPPGCSESLIQREADFYQIVLPPSTSSSGGRGASLLTKHFSLLPNSPSTYTVQSNTTTFTPTTPSQPICALHPTDDLSGYAVARILCMPSTQFGYSCPGVEAFALSPSLQKLASFCPRPPFGTLANVLEQMDKVGFVVVHMTPDFVCWKLVDGSNLSCS
ncbi:K+ channel tetramerization subfamily protein [Pelomyxa schiedti]|nr:K+ channel tetramerization subfamily protein [Pelomyxa schiedti]